MSKVSNILWLLHRLFVKYDATTAEINQLIITKTNDVCAAGTFLTIDDDALDRHKEPSIRLEGRVQDDIEREAAKPGIPYVQKRYAMKSQAILRKPESDKAPV